MTTPDRLRRLVAEVRRSCGNLPAPVGDAFERLTAEALLEFGFFNVRRQLSGTQFGRDFSADYNDPEVPEPTHWYFECKNLAQPIGAGQVAPKLVWQLSASGLTGGFVVIGPGPISNELFELLERTEFPFHIFNWTAENFVRLLALCPQTCSRWFPGLRVAATETELATWREQLMRPSSAGFEMAQPLRLLLRPKHEDRPPQYAYFVRDGHFQKWNTALDFAHSVTLFNAARWPIILRSIRVTTLNQSPPPPRLLIFQKAKGIFQPIALKYAPRSRSGESVELLAPRLLRLFPRETEVHFLELESGASPGCFELALEVEYDGNGRSYVARLAPIRVYVAGDHSAMHSAGNFLALNVWRKYYDRIARRILELDPSTWQHIYRAALPNTLLYAGPPPCDDFLKRPPNWGISRVRLLEDPTSQGDHKIFDEVAEPIMELGDFPEETPPPDSMLKLATMSELYGVSTSQLMGLPEPERDE